MFDGLVKDSQRVLGWDLKKKGVSKSMKDSVGESLEEFKKNGRQNLELLGVLPSEGHQHLQELSKTSEHSIVSELEHKPTHIEKHPIVEKPPITLEDKLNGIVPVEKVESSKETTSIFAEPTEKVVNLEATYDNIARLRNVSYKDTRTYLRALIHKTKCNTYMTRDVYKAIDKEVGVKCFSLRQNFILGKKGVVRMVVTPTRIPTQSNTYVWDTNLFVYGNGSHTPSTSASDVVVPAPPKFSDYGIAKVGGFGYTTEKRLAHIEAKVDSLRLTNKANLGLDWETKQSLAEMEGYNTALLREVADIENEYNTSTDQLISDLEFALNERRLFDFVELALKVIDRNRREIYRLHSIIEMNSNHREILHHLLGLGSFKIKAKTPPKEEESEEEK